MKHRVQRFVVFPFSGGCTSQSGVGTATTSQPPARKQKSQTKPSPTRRKRGGESSSKEKVKSSGFGFLAFPKHNIYSGIHKLIRSIKTLSQVFVYKDEEEEEMEREMEIGYPTDVKHVTHIGLDGTTTTNPVKGWENLKAPEIMSFPSVSLRQFELAMAAQAHAPNLLLDPANSKLANFT